MSRRLTVNPVLTRELRQRVRGRQASIMLTGYLAVLALAAGLLIWGLARSSDPGSTVSQSLGRTLFAWLLFGSLGLVCFIVPGVAAGAVASERERLTLVPLQVTLLTPGQVLRGKLLASLALTTLLLVATLPLLSVAYVLGGVTVPQIIGGLLFVLASAGFLGVLSIWASTVLRRVQRATLVAYGLVGLLVLGTPVAYGLQVLATSSVVGGRTGWESLLLVAPNPFVVTADALGHADDGSVSPFSPSQWALRRRDERRGGRGELLVESTDIDVSSVPPPPLPPPSLLPMRDPLAPGAVVGPLVPAGPGTVFEARPPSVVVESAEGEAFGEGRGGDLTDRGPIWVWTFGWWALLGGLAYLHATRKLRLPSREGVRP